MNYDAVVVGTGFGGTIAATLLAKQRKNVLMLERGTWWVTPEKLGKPPDNAKQSIPDWARQQNPPQPVQYWPRPDHKEGLLDLFTAIRHGGNPHGLYDYRMFDEAHILTSSGVGGGSLIYSNVTLRPNPDVLAGLKSFGLNLSEANYKAAYDWMSTYRGKLSQIVTKIPLPGRNVSNLGADDYLYLDRSRNLRDAVAKAGPDLGIVAQWAPLDLSVIEYDPDPKSDASAAHTFCERQGRCMLGCLPAARHTLNKTIYSKLLTDKTLGVTLQPLCEVRNIKPVAGGYEVTFLDHRNGGDEQTVTAPIVFLAAGTLGTTEILLRSQGTDGGLKASAALGSKFSSNGDFGAFAFGTDTPVYSTRGPINTCHVQFKVDGSYITVEDCAIPSMFAAMTNAALGVLSNFAQREAFKGMMKLSWMTKTMPPWRDFIPHLPDTFDPNDARTEAEIVANIFFFNVMGQDRGDGQFSLHGDQLDLTWKNSPADDPIFAKIETLLKALSGAMGAQYIPFPLWDGFLDKKIIVVHPLGGCPIGTDNRTGAVDEFGRLYDGNKPPGSKDVFPGIYVVDGSTIPGPLVANPTLTIAAQALKAVTAALPGVLAARAGLG